MPRTGTANGRLPRGRHHGAIGCWDAAPFRAPYEKLRHDLQWEIRELATGRDVMREAPDDAVAFLNS